MKVRYSLLMMIGILLAIMCIPQLYSQCPSNLLVNGSLEDDVQSARPADGWTTFLSDPDVTDDGPWPSNNIVWAGQPVSSTDGGTWQSFVGPFEHIEQIVELEPGCRYKLELEYASQSIFSYVTNDTLFGDPTGVKITINDQLMLTSDIDNSLFTWESTCLSFFAEQETTTIKVSGIIDFGYLGVDGLCLYKDLTQIDIRDSIICIDESITIELDTSLIVATSWLDSEIDNEPELDEEGVYWIDVSDECGSYRDEFTLISEDCGCALFVPNIFSPYASGVNSSLTIESTCSLKMYSINVFDRWGNVVFKSDSPLSAWDGIGYENGTYVYHLEYSFDSVNMKMLAGDVLLIK